MFAYSIDRSNHHIFKLPVP